VGTLRPSASGQEVDMSFDETTGEWNQGDNAQEQGAQVLPPTRTVYRFSCSCGTVGQQRDTMEDANADGIQHELSAHPRVFSIEQYGAY
jgi:hypothetical protein